MEIYCGLNTYKKNDILTLTESKDVNGIIIGDMFCQNKMFDNGNSGFYDCIKDINESNKRLIYQTPIYVTSRNKRDVFDTIKHLSESHKSLAILTQDFGVIRYVQRHFENIDVVWSRMGRSREYSFNKMFYSTLKQLGVHCFETDSKVIANELIEIDICPWIVYGNIYYNTMGRKCICKYQLDMEGLSCENVCRSGEYSLSIPEKKFDVTLDGYILGEKLKYNTGVFDLVKENSVVVCYAKEISEMSEKLNDIKRWGA